MSILDHVSITVSDFSRSKAFYVAALKPLDISILMESEGSVGFGHANRNPDFWVGPGPASYQAPDQLRIITPIHLAFRARSRAEVDAFYQAALAAGGRDFGAPRLRPRYHPNYYGAFILDPDGHNVEAVVHTQG